MTPELKQCPFCGGAAMLVAPTMGKPYVCCDANFCTGPKPSADDAIAAWNRRADLCQPKVKPLVWGAPEPFDEIVCQTAQAKNGTYMVIKDNLGLFRVWLDQRMVSNGEGTEAEGIAFAEAHYTAWALDLHKQLFEGTE